MHTPPLSRLPLARAWAETLCLWGCGVAAAILIPRTATFSGAAVLALLAGTTVAVAAVSAMYAATRSPRPAALRWSGYGCAALVLAAWLAL